VSEQIDSGPNARRNLGVENRDLQVGDGAFDGPFASAPARDARTAAGGKKLAVVTQKWGWCIQKFAACAESEIGGDHKSVGVELVEVRPFRTSVLWNGSQRRRMSWIEKRPIQVWSDGECGKIRYLKGSFGFDCEKVSVKSWRCAC
jgi:hypothetical protein